MILAPLWSFITILCPLTGRPGAGRQCSSGSADGGQAGPKTTVPARKPVCDCEAGLVAAVVTGFDPPLPETGRVGAAVGGTALTGGATLVAAAVDTALLLLLVWVGGRFTAVGETTGAVAVGAVVAVAGGTVGEAGAGRAGAVVAGTAGTVVAVAAGVEVAAGIVLAGVAVLSPQAAISKEPEITRTSNFNKVLYLNSLIRTLLSISLILPLIKPAGGKAKLFVIL